MSSTVLALDWQPIQQCLAVARTTREGFADLWDDSLDKLASLQATLEGWQCELTEKQTQLDRQRTEFERLISEQGDAAAAECATLRCELETAQAELSDLQTQLEATRTSHDEAATARTEVDHLTMQLETEQTNFAAEHEVAEQLRAKFERVTKQLNESGGAQARIVDLEEQLADSQSELDRQSCRAEKQQQQCMTLETELEMVRARAADVAETLAQERHQMTEERAESAEEMRQLRSAAERHAAETLATGSNEQVQTCGNPPSMQATAAACSSDVPTTPSDLVLGSVLAQFARIRRQRVERRARGTW